MMEGSYFVVILLAVPILAQVAVQPQTTGENGGTPSVPRASVRGFPTFPQANTGIRALTPLVSGTRGGTQFRLNTGTQQLPQNTGTQQLPVNTGTQQLPVNTGAQQFSLNTGSQQFPQNTGAQPLSLNTGAQGIPQNTGAQQIPAGIPPTNGVNGEASTTQQQGTPTGIGSAQPTTNFLTTFGTSFPGFGAVFPGAPVFGNQQSQQFGPMPAEEFFKPAFNTANINNQQQQQRQNNQRQNNQRQNNQRRNQQNKQRRRTRPQTTEAVVTTEEITEVTTEATVNTKNNNNTNNNNIKRRNNARRNNNRNGQNTRTQTTTTTTEPNNFFNNLGFGTNPGRSLFNDQTFTSNFPQNNGVSTGNGVIITHLPCVHPCAAKISYK